MIRPPPTFFFFFFNDTATTEIYTLSLHDALPISRCGEGQNGGLERGANRGEGRSGTGGGDYQDRKSTRLNSSHGYISYAVFCLKKKKSDNDYTFAMRHGIGVRDVTTMISRGSCHD